MAKGKRSSSKNISKTNIEEKPIEFTSNNVTNTIESKLLQHIITDYLQVEYYEDYLKDLDNVLNVINQYQLIYNIFDNPKNKNMELGRLWNQSIINLFNQSNKHADLIFVACKLILVTIEHSKTAYFNGVQKWTSELIRGLQKNVGSSLVTIEIIKVLSKLFENSINHMELQREVINLNLPLFNTQLVTKLHSGSEELQLACLKAIYISIHSYPKQFRNQAVSLKNYLISTWINTDKEKYTLKPNSLIANWNFKCLASLCLTQNNTTTIAETFNKDLICIIDTANKLLDTILESVQEPYKNTNDALTFDLTTVEIRASNVSKYHIYLNKFLLACQGIVCFLNFNSRSNSLCLSAPINKLMDLICRIYSFGINSNMLENANAKSFVAFMSILPTLQLCANDVLLKMCQIFGLGMLEHSKTISNIVQKLFHNSIGYNNLRIAAYKLVHNLIYFMGDKISYLISESLVKNIIEDLSLKQPEKTSQNIKIAKKSKSNILSNSDALLNKSDATMYLIPKDTYEVALKTLSLCLKQSTFLISYESIHQIASIIYSHSSYYLSNEIKLDSNQKYQLFDCLLYSSLFDSPAQNALLELANYVFVKEIGSKDVKLNQLSKQALYCINLKIHPQLPAAISNVKVYQQIEKPTFTGQIITSNNDLLNTRPSQPEAIDNHSDVTHSSIDIENEKDIEDVKDIGNDNNDELEVVIEEELEIINLPKAELIKRSAEEDLNLQNNKKVYVDKQDELEESNINVDLNSSTEINVTNEVLEPKVEDVHNNEVQKEHVESNIKIEQSANIDELDSDDESIPDIVI